MAGSQLKQLKEALKSQGLIGQTNIKKKNKKSKTPSETRKNENHHALQVIRKDFNKFDSRVNRTKHDVSVIKGGKFVRVGSEQFNNSSRTKANAEREMKLQYAGMKSSKGRTGGIIDRRFGENNKNLTAEEIMLKRFTSERQRGSKRKIDYALGSDEEDESYADGLVLTHAGKALPLEDDLEEAVLGGGSNPKYVDNENLIPIEKPSSKRKSKAEVMKEIIAKSKFHKRQRQLEHQKTQDEILDLDDNFDQVFQALDANMANVETAKFSSKPAEEIEYDSKVRELTYDRRSVPADRTKTEEELRNDRIQMRKKLEEDRLKRMNGEFDDERNEADDLNNFWEADDSEDIDIKPEREENEEEEEESFSQEEGNVKPWSRSNIATISIPLTLDSLRESLSELSTEEIEKKIKRMIELHQPKLAEGNKEKLSKFAYVVLEYLLDNFEESNLDEVLLAKLLPIIKKTGEKYSEQFVSSLRELLNNIHDQVDNSAQFGKKNLLLFTIIGYIFSTSDHYHLVVTPAIIIISKRIASIRYEDMNSLTSVGETLFLVEILLKYQRISKRFVPEVLSALEMVFLSLTPNPVGIETTFSILKHDLSTKVLNFDESSVQIKVCPISISDIYGQSDMRGNYLNRLLEIFESILTLWRDLPSFYDIATLINLSVGHLIKFTQDQKVGLLLERTNKLLANIHRVPLQLQHHRSNAIPTQTPKFEVNFNPDKKSYDDDRTRQELNKMKSLFKKEKKAALKDIRKQGKFIANEQIREKKQYYDDYHKKMANIVNTISTIEGAEKNEYERAKKKRN